MTNDELTKVFAIRHFFSGVASDQDALRIYNELPEANCLEEFFSANKDLMLWEPFEGNDLETVVDWVDDMIYDLNSLLRKLTP